MAEKLKGHPPLSDALKSEHEKWVSCLFYLDKFNRLILEERYLDSDLSLQHLADKLGISSHHLSQMLNDKPGRCTTTSAGSGSSTPAGAAQRAARGDR